MNPIMRRSAIAAAWLLGATVPALVAVVFSFGCCVLPFHGVIHKVLPLCGVAADLIRVEHQQHSGSHAPLPAQAKQEPVKRVATDMPRSTVFAASCSRANQLTAIEAHSYRSFVALGALRCDQDVGLHLLVCSILI